MSAATAETDACKTLDRNWLFAGGTLLVGLSALYADKRRARRNRKRQEDAVDWCFGEDASDEEEPADADTLFDEQEAGEREMIGHLSMARTAAAVALAPPPACGCADSPLPRAGEGQGVRALGPGKPASLPRVRSKPSATLRGRWWLATCLLIAALFAGSALRGTSSLPLAPQERSAATRAHQPATQTIETIRVGQRVVTATSSSSQCGEGSDTQVDPATWRLLRLRAEDRWRDGTLDVVHIETLQPPEWIAAQHAVVGGKVPLPLDLREMGLPESLRAEVTANDPCPPIALGPGRVVLTTVNHLNPNVLELTLADERGRQEQLRPTGTHKFYSVDRTEFIAAEDLREGEHLQGAKGRLTLLRRDRLPGVHRVYNMTVEGEHVYRVSLLGALVHNTCPNEFNLSRARYAEAAQHVEDAQAAGHPTELTIDRAGAAARRAEALVGHERVPGMQLDEYPPAMFSQGGAGASVRPISPSDNMGAGAAMGNFLRPLPDGATVTIRVVD